MMRTLVDTSVLLDVLTDDARWRPWSRAAVADAARLGAVGINQIIFAELAPRMRSRDEHEAAVPARFERFELPWDAAFLAGKAFAEYRRRGGPRTSPLPDFYIGAHAEVDGLTLLTRDAARYRTYFPDVELIAPDGA
jgi:predicted nucleic acid-binding protein